MYLRVIRWPKNQTPKSNHSSFSFHYSILMFWNYQFLFIWSFLLLSLPLPGVINFKFPLQPHRLPPLPVFIRALVFVWRHNVILDLQEVQNRFVGLVKMLDSGDVLKIDQEHLETVIPALGKAYTRCFPALSQSPQNLQTDIWPALSPEPEESECTVMWTNISSDTLSNPWAFYIAYVNDKRAKTIFACV